MSTYIKRLRVTVSSWDETTITGTTNDDHRPCVIINSSPSPLNSKLSPLNSNYIYPGAQLNLLLSEVLPDGRLLPQHIVLNPDYLIDVTAICRCFGHTGDAPALYLLHQFMPSETSAAILLGNVANQFLDDCVNQSTPDYRTSLVNAFCADPLRFATVEGIDGDFGQACRKQFANIQNTVSKLHSDGSFPIEDCELETAFICEALGIQGRMDLVSADRQHIIELKSGRGEEFGRPPGEPGFRYEHALQMALYKESLYYNADLPYARVHTSLLYSRYPSLQEIHLGRNDIHRAIDVRNGIVHLQHLLQRQSASLIDALTEAHFNVRGIYDRFYNNYLRPPILTFLETLKGMSATEHAYFHTFLGFVAREQNLAKTGIEGQNMPPGYGGFADIWRTTAAQKRKAGNLIADLRIRPIADETGIVAIEATLTEPTEANFRCGDIVMLHEQAADGNDLEAQQKAAAMFTTCVIEKLEAESILLRLRYPQRNTKVFDQSRLYAIEPTHADANYSGLYRGLFALLTAPLRRRQLLLGQREPEFDETVQLNRPIDDAEGRDITLRAKQARDYFLLVGPPKI